MFNEKNTMNMSYPALPDDLVDIPNLLSNQTSIGMPSLGIDGGMMNSNQTNLQKLLCELIGKNACLNDTDILNFTQVLEQSKNKKPETNMFEFIIKGVLLTSISIFGLIGNTIAIIVLSRPCMKGSFSTLLIGRQNSIFQSLI